MNNSAMLILLGMLSAVHSAEPIRLHPDNPRWFQWRGKTVALITSAEHYGAVLNQDFDCHRYLETLHRDGMNYTRIFAGSYVEPPGAFGIERNTLAPAPGRFLAPWARSDQPGYAGGGNKFDLDRFSPEYLARLKEFLAEAGKRGIVVELTFFCSTYGAQQWAVHPMNPTNHIQGHAVADWRKLNTSANSVAVMTIQEKLTRWLVRELNDFDNLFYEIQNEPWADNNTMGDYINPYLVDQHRWPNAVQVPTAESVAWQRRIAQAIVAEEESLPRRHLIAQNVANFRLALRDEDLVPEASIINFHYAYPEALDWNRGMGRVIGYDETGFAGREDATYRRQAWNFMLGGGGLFNHLDYSFSVGAEDGTDTMNKAPGGGSPALRKQLSVLSDFLHGFELARLNPDRELIRRAPGVVTQVLSDPGRAYAIYARGRGPTEISLVLPKGQWVAQWIATDDGRVLKEESILGTGAVLSISSPGFSDDLALRIKQRTERERAHGVFSVKPDNTGTLLDGKPFLAIGLRLSNALVSDEKTDELIGSLGTFAQYGVNTISVFFQGSRFGDVRGYREDASLDPVYAARMSRIIKAARERGMVVLVGCLYHGDSKGWWRSWKQADAERAIANTIRWLKEHNYRNVFVDVNNEHMAEFDDEKLIAAGKAVDPRFVIATSGKLTPPNADLSIHHGSPNLPGKYYIETEGTGDNYWGAYSKQPGLYDYINIGVYTEQMKAAMLKRTDAYLNRGQGYLFASTWLQNPPPAGPNHTPGGIGTQADPGVRWWLEHIQQRQSKGPAGWNR